MKKLLVLALCAALALTMLVGCSSGNSDSKTTAQVIDIDLTEEEYAFGVDKDQPELLASVNELIGKMMSDGRFEAICDKYFGDGKPEAVKSAKLDNSKDQLVVATNAAFEPFEYKEGDSFYGIDMEIAAVIAKELGLELVISDMDFDAVCLSVGQHKADIAMAGLTVREDRKEFVEFSTSYYNASQKLIVKSGDDSFKDCKTGADVEAKLKSMSGIKVGVQNGTTGQFYVQGDEDWGFEGLGCECIGYRNGSLAVQDLLNGNINYVIIDSAPAAAITKAINALR
ncbi:MAG: transporter substrate-binding domain-containing protein [Lachnospiraceae bacterium]|nr:transporter substrate-binding domain-containing protein [Lachnospiraceae bacterium]